MPKREKYKGKLKYFENLNIFPAVIHKKRAAALCDISVYWCSLYSACAHFEPVVSKLCSAIRTNGINIAEIFANCGRPP